MTKRIILFIAAFIFNALCFAQDVPASPNPPKLVNDFVGGFLSPAEISMLEDKLVAYNDSTSTQVTIVIVNSTEPYTASQYAFKIGREWGVGTEDFSNGVVLLWAPADRQIAIATGYGMEGALPDIYAKRIISRTIGPLFQNEQYYQGLNQGTSEIFKYASGEYKAEPKDDIGEISPLTILLLFLMIYLLLRFLSKNSGNGNNNNGRGLRGSGWPYTTYHDRGSQSGHWMGRGGGFGGGFGGGGGGFGGFGGGGFGGGGASGGY